MLLKAYKVDLTKPEQGEAWDSPIIGYARESNWTLVADTSKPINRGQVAKLLTNAAGKNFNVNDSIHYLLDEGLSNGKTERSIAGYKGNDLLTRAESISFIKNVVGKLSTLNPAPKVEEKYINPNSDISPVLSGVVVPLQDIKHKKPTLKIPFRKELKSFKVSNIEYTPLINDLTGAIGFETNYELNGKYTKLNAKVAVDDTYDHDFMEIKILGDRKLLYSSKVFPGQEPQVVEIDLTGINEITIKAENYRVPGGYVLPLKDNARLLTVLPVRVLLNIMTVSQKRKRMLPMDVSLRQQVHGMHPQLNMVIVSKYELDEKSSGVFCSVCRNGSISLLWERA